MIISNAKKIKIKYNNGFTLIELVIVIAGLAALSAFSIPSYMNAVKLSPADLKEIILQDPIHHLYGLELKSAREEFDKIYLKHHLDNNINMKELSKVSGVERTHLYRKLKQLGLKNSK